MDEKELESPGLLWTCFVNWINTLEKVRMLNSTPDQIRDEKITKLSSH